VFKELCGPFILVAVGEGIVLVVFSLDTDFVLEVLAGNVEELAVLPVLDGHVSVVQDPDPGESVDDLVLVEVGAEDVELHDEGVLEELEAAAVLLAEGQRQVPQDLELRQGLKTSYWVLLEVQDP